MYGVGFRAAGAQGLGLDLVAFSGVDENIQNCSKELEIFWAV